MERATPFVPGEYYHLYTRGVAKQRVFLNDRDLERFMVLMYLCNSTSRVHIANTLKKYQGEPLINVIEGEQRGQMLAEVVAYALLPSHIHLIVKEVHEGGISKLMLKMMTAYSMYFNTKHGRSGPVFTRPFRSRHITGDDDFRWVFAYVLLNPLDLYDPDWKRRKISANKDFASYRYCSYMDYYTKRARPESAILEKKSLPIENLPSMDQLLHILSLHADDKNIKGNP